MILVVYNHVCGYMLGITAETNTPLLVICQAFRMPMFFFISGYIAYKPLEYWTPNNTLQRLSKKAKVQLIPTFVFWSVYYLFVRHIQFPDGFWFTLVLFEMFLLYYGISFLCNRLFKRGWIPIMILLALTMIVFRSKILVFTFEKYLSIGELITYFSFFVFGIICRSKQEIFERILKRDGFLAGLTVFTTAYFLFLNHSDDIGFRISATFTRIALGIPLILIIYNVFHRSQSYWSQNGTVSRHLQFVGRRTLDIYLIHNFFLVPAIPQLSNLFGEQNNEAFLVIVAGLLTFVIVLLCLLFSTVLRSSNFFSKWLFGVQSK